MSQLDSQEVQFFTTQDRSKDSDGKYYHYGCLEWKDGVLVFDFLENVALITRTSEERLQTVCADPKGLCHYCVAGDPLRKMTPVDHV